MLTYNLAKRDHRSRIQSNRIPVFVSLREHVGKLNVDEIISNTLVNHYSLQGASYARFLRLLKAGKLVVIFDGFDEVATDLNRSDRLRLLRSLNSLVYRNSKVILTCRTHFFRSDKETLLEIDRSVEQQETELFAEQKGRPNYRILQLREFRLDQIRSFILKRCDNDEEATRKTLSRIARVFNLLDLSRRAVMLEMILKVWSTFQDSESVSAPELYRRYVEKWINDVAKGNEGLIDSNSKLRFCEDLARWLYSEGKERLPYSQLESLVSDYFHEKSLAAIAALDSEIRTSSFLIRDSLGNYEFAHRSFAEYFVARACASELGSQTYELFQCRLLPPEVKRFLAAMLTEDQLCWSAVEWTKGRDTDECGYVGSNAATLLRLRGASFAGRNLDKALLPEADLTNADLSEVSLRGASLKGAILINARLRGADFREADLSRLRIAEMGSVSSVAWSPDGRLIVVGEENGNISIWETRGPNHVGTLRGHTSPVLSLGFEPSSRYLFSCAESLCAWDVLRLTQTSFGEGFHAKCSTVYYTVESDTEKWRVRLRRFHRNAYYSSSPRYTVEVRHSAITVRDWHRSGRVLLRTAPQKSKITSASYSPNDLSIAVGAVDGRVIVWDAFTGMQLAVLEQRPIECDGLRIEGAKGLSERGYAVEGRNRLKRNGTLREWLVARGAVP